MKTSKVANIKDDDGIDAILDERFGEFERPIESFMQVELNKVLYAPSSSLGTQKEGGDATFADDDSDENYQNVKEVEKMGFHNVMGEEEAN